MARQFNYIYNQLVKKDQDLIGHIAYSLYKKKKQQFLDNWKKEHPGQEIDERELDNFHKSESTPEAISEYKTKAKLILQKFCNNLLGEETKKIEKACKLNQEKILKDILPEQSSLCMQYLHGSIQSIIGAIGFALLVALISFIAYFGRGSLPITITYGNDKSDSVKTLENKDSNIYSTTSTYIEKYTHSSDTVMLSSNNASR